MNRGEREELLRRLDQIADPSSAPTVRVGVTYAASVYPTLSAAWYAMADQTIGGDESEGSGASFNSGETFRAFNLGVSLPPVGSKHICYCIEGRYVFRS